MDLVEMSEQPKNFTFQLFFQRLSTTYTHHISFPILQGSASTPQLYLLVSSGFQLDNDLFHPDAGVHRLGDAAEAEVVLGPHHTEGPDLHMIEDRHNHTDRMNFPAAK